MLGHNNLSNYYKNLFVLSQHYGHKISDIENMIVYEIDVFKTLIEQWLKEKALEEQNNG